MQPFRHFVSLVWLVASFAGHAGEQSTTDAKGAANQPVAVELQPLQGTWEGVMVGQEKNGNITITITSNSLHFHRDTNFWFETTFTQPVGTDPKQLHATIKDCATGQQDSSIGKVVIALYKIEDGVLTLVPLGGEEIPKSFEATKDKGLARYELRKVQTQNKNAGKSNSRERSLPFDIFHKDPGGE